METNLSRSKQCATIAISTLIHILLIFLLITYKEIAQQKASQQQQKDTLITTSIPLAQSPNTHQPIRFQSPQTPSQTPAVAQPQQQQQQIVQPETTPSAQQQQQKQEQIIQPHAIASAEPNRQPATSFTKPKINQNNEPQSTMVKKPLPKQQPTLKEITKNFVKTMDPGRTTLTEPETTQGQVLKSIPDARDLAFKSYQTKTFNQMQKSVNTMGTSLFLASNIETTAKLLLTINKNGSFESLVIEHPVKTENMMRLEEHLRQAARSTGLYPPIPSYLNVERITHTFSLKIHARAGTAFYYLMPATF